MAQTTEQTNRQLKLAIYAGQESVTIEGKIFKLPSPQKTGTVTQKLSYAQQCADKLQQKAHDNPRKIVIDYYKD